MPLIVLLLVLILLTGGVGFGGFVALGSLDILVKILFGFLLISLIIAVVRNIVSTGGPGPYDPIRWE